MSQQSQQPMGGMGQETYGGGSMGASQGMGGQQMGGQMGGQQMGARPGTSHQTTHQQVGQQFESELTPELNQALEAFDRVVEIASWCADKCIEMGPEMAECARLCLDLAEVAELNEKLIARDSINGPEVAETYLRVAQQGLPILEQFQQSPHVQETLQAVHQSIESTNKLLNSIGGQQGFQEMAQQMGGQQMGGQQMGGQQPQGQQFQSQQPQSGGQSQMGQQFPQSY